VILFCAIFFMPLWSVFSQAVTVSGRVTDVATGDPVPFANVFFQGTQTGITTDFDGYYTLTSNQHYDSIVVRYVGYKTKTKTVTLELQQEIDFQIEEDVITLHEVVFRAGENPAFSIMRNVVKNKDKNNKQALEAYEYASYTKIEVDVDNISDKFNSRKVVRNITSIMDSVRQIAGEDGKPVLPVFMSEALSRYYYKKNPEFKHENIIKTKVSGIGITDGTLTSQFIGTTFQEYNFYRNWLNIVEKEFISPIADGWKGYYEYDLIDSLLVGDDFCYRLDFFPRRKQDLAFSGTIWITRDEYALKQIDATINRSANLNYIERIKIQQELAVTPAGPWLPVKTRVLIDVGEITGKMAGMLAKFYVSNKDIVINEPRPDDFYELPIVMEEDIREYDDDFWEAERHDPLTDTEISVYEMIDTMKAIPFIKVSTELSKFAANGYIPVGVFDLGPYSTMFAQNNIEGYRFGFGLRTNLKFSRKVVLEGSLGYGTLDSRWKYGAGVKYILSRSPWTTIKLGHKLEIDPIWILNEEVGPQSLFYAYSRFGTLSSPFAHQLSFLRFETQSGRGWVNRLYLRHQLYDPEFDFRYIKGTDTNGVVMGSNFSTAEISVETQYARDELFVINDNERLSLGPVRYPSIKLRYTLGVKNIFGSDFSYHTLYAEIKKNQKMGIFGSSLFTLSGSNIFSALPYPLLKAHVGNETPFYISFANNLMDYFEFSSDHYGALRWRHHFEGLVLNRVPLIRLLKWRLTAHTDVIYGGMRKENIDLVVPGVNPAGEPVMPFYTFDHRPYVEVGYGVENVFKVLRVDAFHRLTYLDRSDVRKFGIKFSFQFIL